MQALQSVKARLIGTLALLTIAACLVGYIGYQGLTKVDSELSYAMTNLLPSLGALGVVNEAITDGRLATRDAIIALQNKHPEKVRTAQEQRDKAFQRLAG